jgi:hypothetical protein
MVNQALAKGLGLIAIDLVVIRCIVMGVTINDDGDGADQTTGSILNNTIHFGIDCRNKTSSFAHENCQCIKTQ